MSNSKCYFKEEQYNPSVNTTGSYQGDAPKSNLLTHPFKGKRGEITLRKITNKVSSPVKHKATLAYTCTKPGYNFNIKDKCVYLKVN